MPTTNVTMELPQFHIEHAEDAQLAKALRHRIDRKTKPPGSLGLLEDLALQLGLIQATQQPVVRRPAVLVFAGDHGLSDEGVSPYPREVTAQMVENFRRGGAAINAFARCNDAGVLVIDAGTAADFAPDTKLPLQDFSAQDLSGPRILDAKLRPGARNALRENALSRDEVALAMAHGRHIVARLHDGGTNTILPGEMGIGNTSSASLMHALLTATPVAQCAGRGTGLDDAGLAQKIRVLERAEERIRAECNAPPRTELRPLAAIEAAAGCEIAMMIGAMLAAAERRMVILVDGYIAGAAALAAIRLEPAVQSYCVFAHRSAEQGHRLLLDAMHARPLLDLGLRLGEGTGAALALPLLRAATAFLNDMASFDEAGVSDRS